MTTPMHDAITNDYAKYVDGLALDDLEFDLTPTVAELLRMTREAAFRSGWDSGRQWQAKDFSEAPTKRIARSIRAMEVGDHAWIQPTAIIQQGESEGGALFLDPRFATRGARSVGYTIRLSKLEEGFVAVGPTDQHRIHLQPINPSFFPLLRLEPAEPESPIQTQ